MSKDFIHWPENPMDAKRARSLRMAAMHWLRRRNTEEVDKMLVEVRTCDTFSIVSLLETTHCANDHLKEFAATREILLEKLKQEDYTEELINKIASSLKDKECPSSSSSTTSSGSSSSDQSPT